MMTGISHFFYLRPEARDGSKSREQNQQKGNVEVRDTSMLMLLPSNVADQATLEGSSCTDIMTCTGGCGYSF